MGSGHKEPKLMRPAKGVNLGTRPMLFKKSIAQKDGNVKAHVALQHKEPRQCVILVASRCADDPQHRVSNDLFVRRLFRQRRRVDAVAQPCRARPVRKDVPEMRLALAAQHFSPFHEMAAVGFGRDIVFADRRGETGPAGARVEFVVRREQFLSAADAGIGARLMIIAIFAGKGPLGALFPGDLILLVRQLRFPFCIGFDDFIGHKCLPLAEGYIGWPPPLIEMAA